eukprot:704437-Pleurochrysis_carterae.AAC.1
MYGHKIRAERVHLPCIKPLLTSNAPPNTRYCPYCSGVSHGLATAPKLRRLRTQSMSYEPVA